MPIDMVAMSSAMDVTTFGCDHCFSRNRLSACAKCKCMESTNKIDRNLLLEITFTKKLEQGSADEEEEMKFVSHHKDGSPRNALVQIPTTVSSSAK